MKKTIVAMFAVGAVAIFFLTGMADQPGAKDKGPKKGPGDKKGWEPGKVLPPFVRDALDLTEDQQKKIDELEKEVRAKLLKILTEEQLQRARELKGPKGPPKDFDGPPDKKGKKGKDKDGPPKDGQARADDGGRPVEKIAKELGVTPEQFREAFKKVKPAPKGQQPTDAQREANRKVLSEALGVSPEKLDAVMDKYRPEGPNEKKGKGK